MVTLEVKPLLQKAYAYWHSSGSVFLSVISCTELLHVHVAQKSAPWCGKLQTCLMTIMPRSTPNWSMSWHHMFTLTCKRRYILYILLLGARFTSLDYNKSLGQPEEVAIGWVTSQVGREATLLTSHADIWLFLDMLPIPPQSSLGRNACWTQKRLQSASRCGHLANKSYFLL